VLAGGVARNIAHNLALLGRDVHLISAVGSDFYGETLLEQTRQAGLTCKLYSSARAQHLYLPVDR
jgi:sugar/nucleoside kinase (ribokinase family)